METVYRLSYFIMVFTPSPSETWQPLLRWVLEDTGDNAVIALKGF